MMWCSRPEDLPAAAGAYVLLITLTKPVTLPAKFGTACLAPGTYLYAGSAHGPGGIKARCRRHFKKRKRRHWHIDWLTLHASAIKALTLPGLGECQIVAALAGRDDIAIPVPRFGSSDCRTCPAHLLKADVTSAPPDEITTHILSHIPLTDNPPPTRSAMNVHTKQREEA